MEYIIFSVYITIGIVFSYLTFTEYCKTQGVIYSTVRVLSIITLWLYFLIVYIIFQKNKYKIK